MGCSASRRRRKGKALTFPNTSILMKYTFYLRYTFSVKCCCVGIIKRKCLLHLVICQSRYFVVRRYTGDALVRPCLMFYAICMGVRAELFHGAWAAFPVFLQIGSVYSTLDVCVWDITVTYFCRPGPCSTY